MRHVRLAPLVTVRTAFEASVVAARLGADGIGTQLRSNRSCAYPTNVGEVDIFVREDELALARELLLVDEVEAVFADLELGLDADHSVEHAADPLAELPGGFAADGNGADRTSVGQHPRHRGERASSRPGTAEQTNGSPSGRRSGAAHRRWTRPVAVLVLLAAMAATWSAEQLIRNRTQREAEPVTDGDPVAR